MDLVLRAVFLFVFVYALTRIIGRRELSSLERVLAADRRPLSY